MSVRPCSAHFSVRWLASVLTISRPPDSPGSLGSEFRNRECAESRHQLEPTVDPLIESVLQPMRELLSRYVRLSSTVSSAIATLEGALDAPPTGGSRQFAERPAESIASLELESSDVDALLEFQERLSEIPGVMKVTVAGAREGRSRFLIELAAESPTLVLCANCGKTLSEGPPPASHGLCEDCRANFGGPAPLR